MMSFFVVVKPLCDGLADKSSLFLGMKVPKNKNSTPKNSIINVKNPIKFNDQRTFQR